MEQKPRLSLLQIFNMSFGFFGIQIGFGLQSSNVSRIFQTLGAEEGDIPILWLAAPLTGLLIQPIIGYLSDRTWTRLGRRRPFFLIGAILSAIALIIMPQSPTVWVAAGMLWILDASINISMEPFRALVGDNLPPEQRNAGFAMQSILIGSGAVLASLLPSLFTAMGVANEAPDGGVPASVKLAFYCGAASFLLAIGYTVLTTKEYSPEQMAKFEESRKASEAAVARNPKAFRMTVAQLAVVQFFTWFALFTLFIFATPAITRQVYGVTEHEAKKQMPAIVGDTAQYSASQKGSYEIVKSVSGLKDKDVHRILPSIFGYIRTHAETKSKIFEVSRDVYGWDGTIANKKVLETGQAAYDVTVAQGKIFNQGGNWVGIGYAIFNGMAAVFGFLIPMIARRAGRRYTHMACLLVGAVGLGSMYFLPSVSAGHDSIPMLFSFGLIGIAWSSILSMPYAMLSSTIPASRMGFFMGFFNFFICLPQIVASIGGLNWLSKSFIGPDSIHAMLLGGILMGIAALFTLLIKDADGDRNLV